MELKKDYFDHKLPYIWDEYKKYNYITGMLEDMAQIGIFNYGKMGFREPPVDWYPREYWLQMFPEPGDFKINPVMWNTSYYCFDKNGPKLPIFMEQVQQFITQQNSENIKYFLYAFHSQMTHDNFNKFKLMDFSYSQFFKIMRHALNNTIILFAGDHGPRYGPFCFTGLGRLEERLPFVSIRVPDGLAAKYPHLRQNLDKNVARLVTWYDVHKILQEAGRGDFEPAFSPIKSGYPISIWKQEVPLNRTCRDANIDHDYCVCNGVINLNPTAWDVYYAAWSIIGWSEWWSS